MTSALYPLPCSGWAAEGAGRNQEFAPGEWLCLLAWRHLGFPRPWSPPNSPGDGGHSSLAHIWLLGGLMAVCQAACCPSCCLPGAGPETHQKLQWAPLRTPLQCHCPPPVASWLLSPPHSLPSFPQLGLLAFRACPWTGGLPAEEGEPGIMEGLLLLWGWLKGGGPLM